MSRKMIYLDDAIDAVERKKDRNAKGNIGGFYNKIIQNDIDALMQLPPAQPYTDAEIQKMQDLEQAQFEKVYQLGYEEGKKDAQSERKTGRWMEDGIDKWKCSECGKGNNYAYSWSKKDGLKLQDYFCPNCGARMEVEE